MPEHTDQDPPEGWPETTAAKGSDAVRELAEVEHRGDLLAALEQIADLYAYLCAEAAAGARVILHRPDGSSESVALF